MKDKVIAKTVLEDRFWILENKGQRIATISCSGDQYVLNTKSGPEVFTSFRSLKKRFGKDIEFTTNQTVNDSIDLDVHGYPTACTPYNTMYDVKNRLPLFTKSTKSKSLYCAGYYIIRFDKGWVKSFCPKLITIERYKYKGPFRTELEMKQELSSANSK